MRVFDPVAGGEALVVIDIGSDVWAGGLCGPGGRAVALRPRSLWLSRWEGAHLRPGCGRRGAGRTRGDTNEVRALTVFEDPATGGLRLASGSKDRSVRVWDLGAGGAALFVLEGHTGKVNALTAFADPATGETRLVSGSDDKTLRVWDASKGAALRVVAFDDDVSALAVRSDMSGLFVGFGGSGGGSCASRAAPRH